MRRLASERAKGVANRCGGRGKCAENRKKILNSGNEPKNVMKTKELSFSGAKNELVFECKRTPIKAKKVAKNPPIVRH
jgi:Na+-transporting NADH:ubiquinone oxidoreductase subunit NqrF